MRLYRRGIKWWVDLRSSGGDRETTGCTDRAAADAYGRRRERELADPRHAAAAQATLKSAVERLLADRKARERSDGTLDMYATKAGHLFRILGMDMPLAAIDAKAVDRFVDARRADGVGRESHGGPAQAGEYICGNKNEREEEKGEACRHGHSYSGLRHGCLYGLIE